MFLTLDKQQSKQVIESVSTYRVLQDARQKSFDYKGGMHWKTVSGKEYLYRSLDRHGNAKSLGPRSPVTEATYEAFHHRKAELHGRIEDLEKLMVRHAKINAAVEVGHVPDNVADVCVELDSAGLLHHNMMIIGTNAMHAYEALAGVRFPSDLLATDDVDLLWNHTTKLSLAAIEGMKVDKGLIGLLKRADKSYEVVRNQPFRAASNTGFKVDLIRQMPDPPWSDEPDRFFANDDLVATDIWNMKWMLGAPRIEQPVIAHDGRVFMISAPDPRAFAMFKLWLSKAPDREPDKKQRDLAQAQAVISLIEDRLPHYADKWNSLRSFPEEVVKATTDRIQRFRA